MRYIEIIHDQTNTVVKRIDVTGKPERQIERVTGGISINLNHLEFSVEVKEGDALPCGNFEIKEASHD